MLSKFKEEINRAIEIERRILYIAMISGKSYDDAFIDVASRAAESFSGVDSVMDQMEEEIINNGVVYERISNAFPVGKIRGLVGRLINFLVNVTSRIIKQRSLRI